jgi:hypothetical protein
MGWCGAAAGGAEVPGDQAPLDGSWGRLGGYAGRALTAGGGGAAAAAAAPHDRAQRATRRARGPVRGATTAARAAARRVRGRRRGVGVGRVGVQQVDGAAAARARVGLQRARRAARARGAVGTGRGAVARQRGCEAARAQAHHAGAPAARLVGRAQQVGDAEQVGGGGLLGLAAGDRAAPAPLGDLAGRGRRGDGGGGRPAGRGVGRAAGRCGVGGGSARGGEGPCAGVRPPAACRRKRAGHASRGHEARALWAVRGAAERPRVRAVQPWRRAWGRARADPADLKPTVWGGGRRMGRGGRDWAELVGGPRTHS